VIKAGKQANGAQRYRWQNGLCERRIFLLQYQDRGRAPAIRRQVVARAINMHDLVMGLYMNRVEFGCAV
jgi:hypothetical protein